MRKLFFSSFVLSFSAMLLLFNSCKSKPKQRDREMDRQSFVSKLEHYSILEEIAIDAMAYHDTIPKDIYISELGSVALQNWVECVNLMDMSEKLELSEKHQRLRELLTRYAALRIDEVQLLIKKQSDLTADYTSGIDSIQTLLSDIREEILTEEGGFKDPKSEPLETL